MVLDPVMIARHNLKTTSLLNTVRHKTHDNGCSSDVHDLSEVRGEIRLASGREAHGSFLSLGTEIGTQEL